MSGFAWRALLEGGRQVGLRPREVWALTPAELAFLMGRDLSVAPLSRARLSELVRAFPDMNEVRDDG